MTINVTYLNRTDLGFFFFVLIYTHRNPVLNEASSGVWILLWLSTLVVLRRQTGVVNLLRCSGKFTGKYLRAASTNVGTFFLKCEVLMFTEIFITGNFITPC